jgi:alpha-beta hydrolase superfamily lysophospholipase
MKIAEWKWKTSDGLEIYSKEWEPDGKVKGVVCLLHGVGEHTGRYEHVGEALAEAGYIMAGFDIRGFGQSQGKRGHVPSAETYFDDIDSFLAEVAKRHPSVPRFLYGHSMGGILSLAYTPVRKPDVRGVIVSGPGLRTALEEQKFKLFLVKTLGALLPSMTLISGVDSNTLSHDPEVAPKYDSDPLVHHIVSLGWGKAMLGVIDLAFKQAPNFPLPLLMLHGSEDVLSYPKGSREYARLAPQDKVTLKMWEGFKHEVQNEVGRADVFKYMVEWLNKQNR